MVVEIGASALTKVADGLGKELFQSVKGAASKSFGKLQAEFGVGFAKYIERNRNKCRFVKTLLHRIDPIPIEQAYVEPALKIANEVILGGSFPQKLEQFKNVVVVGSGGSGKSMFLKKLFLELCDYPLGRIPVFVELRELNSRSEKDLFDLIYHQWCDLIPSFKIEALETGFRTGKFFLLLDGLDEVDRDEREKISKNITSLSYKFPLCPIVLTSRPIDDFSAWNEFYSAAILPFDIERITCLVEKASIDADVKSKFLVDVREQLFSTHKTFLQNPLLCTMMLLTFTEFEEIPSKMHIFYARAFDVLLTRHDKTKTFFIRKFHTSLAEDDFKRLFSTFCLFSYLERKYSFDRALAVELLKLVFDFESAPVRPSDFLLDMHESISILVRDGDTYSFLHRSFQEYFTALFLAERQVAKMGLLFGKILGRGSSDNVLSLLFEMNRDALESKFLILEVRKFKNELLKIDPKRDLPALLSLMTYKEVSFGYAETAWTPGPRLDLLRFISQAYGFKATFELAELLKQDRWLTLHGRSKPKNQRLPLAI